MTGRSQEGGRVAQAAPKTARAGRRLDSVSVAALRSFVVLVECGSFSRTAEQLGSAVSTVSKHVDLLEHRLSTALFIRNTRRLSLTDSGSALYAQCRTALDSVDEAVDQTFGATEIRGSLRVVAPPSFTHCILGPALPQFLAEHPALSVELKVTTAHVDLMRERVDVAIRMTADNLGGHRMTRLGRAPSTLCASPAYLAQHGEPRAPTDLVQHRCLAGINSPFSETWRFRVGRRIVEIPSHARFTSDTGEVLRHACVQGLGIGGFYVFHIQPELDAGRLVRVLAGYDVDDGHVFAMTPATRFTPRATDALVRFVSGLCAGL